MQCCRCLGAYDGAGHAGGTSGDEMAAASAIHKVPPSAEVKNAPIFTSTPLNAPVGWCLSHRYNVACLYIFKIFFKQKIICSGVTVSCLAAA